MIVIKIFGNAIYSVSLVLNNYLLANSLTEVLWINFALP